MPTLAADPGVVAAYVVGGLGVLAAFVSGALAYARRASGGGSGNASRAPRSVAEGAAGSATVGDWQEWISEIVVRATAAAISTELGPFLREVQRHNKAMERRLTAQNRILMKLLARREET